MFLNALDNLTAMHLRVLRACEHPSIQERDALRAKRNLSDQAIIDFLNRVLIRDTRAYAARNRDSHDALIVEHWEISHLGKKFLEFISHL